MNHLNYFFPYGNKNSDYENNLTRAFLLLIKYLPNVQQMFIDLIREKQYDIDVNYRVPSYSAENIEVAVECQTSSIRNDEGILISSFITDEDIKITEKTKIAKRDNAIYDGIFYLGSNVTIIIEVKPQKSDIWKDQLNPSKSSMEGKDIEPIGCPICIIWTEILERLGNIVTKGVLSFAENTLILDFFEFIDSSPRFSALKPYKTFAVCGDNPTLIKKRCGNILSEIGKVEHHMGWGYCIECNGTCKKVALLASNTFPLEISLDLDPCNTCNGARRFYSEVDLEMLEKAGKNGWNISTNFHLSGSYRQFFWSDCSLGVFDYLKYWKENQNFIRQYKREEYENLLYQLLKDKIISNNNYDELNDTLINSGRNVIRVIPGLSLVFKWPLSEAVNLDRSGVFHETVEEKIREIFTCWDQPYESIIQEPDNTELNANVNEYVL